MRLTNFQSVEDTARGLKKDIDMSRIDKSFDLQSFTKQRNVTILEKHGKHILPDKVKFH